MWRPQTTQVFKPGRWIDSHSKETPVTVSNSLIDTGSESMASPSYQDEKFALFNDAGLRAVRDTSKTSLFSRIFDPAASDKVVLEGDLGTNLQFVDLESRPGSRKSTARVRLVLDSSPDYAVTCSLSQVRPLSEKVYWLLKGVSTSAGRLALLRKGVLDVLNALAVGDRVVIPHPELVLQEVEACVRFIGPVDNQLCGHRIGVVLTTVSKSFVSFCYFKHRDVLILT